MIMTLDFGVTRGRSSVALGSLGFWVFLGLAGLTQAFIVGTL